MSPGSKKSAAHGAGEADAFARLMQKKVGGLGVESDDEADMPDAPPPRGAPYDDDGDDAMEEDGEDDEMGDDDEDDEEVDNGAGVGLPAAAKPKKRPAPKPPVTQLEFKKTMRSAPPSITQAEIDACVRKTQSEIAVPAGIEIWAFPLEGPNRKCLAKFLNYGVYQAPAGTDPKPPGEGCVLAWCEDRNHKRIAIPTMMLLEYMIQVKWRHPETGEKMVVPTDVRYLKDWLVAKEFSGPLKETKRYKMVKQAYDRVRTKSLERIRKQREADAKRTAKAKGKAPVRRTRFEDDAGHLCDEDADDEDAAELAREKATDAELARLGEAMRATERANGDDSDDDMTSDDGSEMPQTPSPAAMARKRPEERVLPSPVRVQIPKTPVPAAPAPAPQTKPRGADFFAKPDKPHKPADPEKPAEPEDADERDEEAERANKEAERKRRKAEADKERKRKLRERERQEREAAAREKEAKDAEERKKAAAAKTPPPPPAKKADPEPPARSAVATTEEDLFGDDADDEEDAAFAAQMEAAAEAAEREAAAAKAGKGRKATSLGRVEEPPAKRARRAGAPASPAPEATLTVDANGSASDPYSAVNGCVTADGIIQFPADVVARCRELLRTSIRIGDPTYVRPDPMAAFTSMDRILADPHSAVLVGLVDRYAAGPSVLRTIEEGNPIRSREQIMLDELARK